jgi:pimeloyl-ACP methyl ester carboxylesterase
MHRADEQPTPAFILIPGAGGMASYWHRVVPLLERGRAEAIAVDLPGDDSGAGLEHYADIVVAAIGRRSKVILVAQSLGGFTASLVCSRAPVGMLVFVNAMIPRPGETAGDWWDNTGAVAARVAAAYAGGYSAEFDPQTYFLHDVPDAVLAGLAPPRAQADTVFKQACNFEAWPRVPIHVFASAGDRFFPLSLQRRIARERLSTDVEVLPGGHLVALSHPEELAGHLLALRREARHSSLRPL